MSDPLLAEGTEQHTDATDASADAAVDTQPTADEQTTNETEGAQNATTETTGTTTKTTEQKVDAPAEQADAEPETKAPELYEFTVPEGLPEDFELAESVRDAIAERARAFDLTQEDAQSLIDKVIPVVHAQGLAQQAALTERWTSELKADPTFGGQHIGATVLSARNAVKAFGDESVQELLNSPVGSHPGLIRLLAKVGQSVSEDSFVNGPPTGEGPVDLDDPEAQARKLYPTSTS